MNIKSDKREKKSSTQQRVNQIMPMMKLLFFSLLEIRGNPIFKSFLPESYNILEYQRIIQVEYSNTRKYQNTILKYQNTRIIDIFLEIFILYFGVVFGTNYCGFGMKFQNNSVLRLLKWKNNIVEVRKSLPLIIFSYFYRYIFIYFMYISQICPTIILELIHSILRHLNQK